MNSATRSCKPNMDSVGSNADRILLVTRLQQMLQILYGAQIWEPPLLLSWLLTFDRINATRAAKDVAPNVREAKEIGEELERSENEYLTASQTV